MNNLLDILRTFDALRDNNKEYPDEVQIKSIPRQPPIYDSSNILENLHPSIKDYVSMLGAENLYEHQAKAIRLALEAKDVVLESPTASGKTLSFLIPMIVKILNNPNSRALLIYPMKAVANDQRRQLNDVTQDFKFIKSWTFDGDTPSEHRSLLKSDPPNILLTNPEMLHLSFLAWSDQWIKFLKNLDFIVIDEIHEYRGFFGTNFALLLRRFLMKLAKMGCNPQLFLCSATCANPLEHAERLTGRKCALVSAANCIRPQRNFAFVNPRIPDFTFQEIYHLRIARASLACLSKDLSCIVFCPSRKFAEDVCKKAKREAEKYNLDANVIAPYKSGLKAEARREIEDGLRTGNYKIVFTTNALELGIDIGKLDVCILAGFPDSMMSAWQRIGRVGRNWNKEAHVLFYAMNNAVDQFYAANIDAFLTKPLDEITTGIGNDELISRHIPYLLHEADWNLSSDDKRILGEDFYNYALEKMKGKSPLKGVRGPNYFNLDVRGTSGSVYKLIYHKSEIGSMSDDQAFREAYIGAIYNHFGKSYRVSSHGGTEILLEDTDPNLYTVPSFYTIVQSTDVVKGHRYDEKISVFYGKLTIFENFAGYQLIDEKNGTVLDEVRSDLSRHKNAHTFLLKFESSDFKDIVSNGINALEHIFRIGATFVMPCDRHDTSTYCSRNSFEIYFYENYPGGIGIAEKAFTVFRDVIQEGMKIAENCNCNDGCPRCIFPPRFKRADGLSKITGIKLANQLLSITSKSAKEIFDSITHGWNKA